MMANYTLSDTSIFSLSEGIVDFAVRAVDEAAWELASDVHSATPSVVAVYPGAAPWSLAFKPVAGQTFTFDGQPGPGRVPTNAFGEMLVASRSGQQIALVTGLAISFADFDLHARAGTLDTLFFAGSDSIFDNKFGHSMSGFGGNDRIYGRAGNDRLSGNAGSDRLYGGADNDTLFGDADNDRLYGGDGLDIIDGGTGNDLIYGEAGRDILKGSAGQDRIAGGAGRDVVTGGEGNDKFAYAAKIGAVNADSGTTALTRDVITDFKRGQDDIELVTRQTKDFVFKGTGAITGAGQVNYALSGNDTLISISTDADRAAEIQILLRGRHDLSASDFIL
jgi:Ca2+-binding RTX toxin-like protein